LERLTQFLRDWAVPLGICLAVLAYRYLIPWEASAHAEAAPIEQQLVALRWEEERRHGELLLRIETLRRQMLKLHGKTFVEDR